MRFGYSCIYFYEMFLSVSAFFQCLAFTYECMQKILISLAHYSFFCEKYFLFGFLCSLKAICPNILVFTVSYCK